MRRLILAIVVAAVLLTGLQFQSNSTNWVRPRTIAAQNDCQLFPETGKSVCGIFLSYWKANGGLAQQGFPISDVFREQSSNGQTYDTQYFERAVFERHPENAGTKFEVLLALLGSEKLKAKYPNGPPAAAVTPPPPAPTVAPAGVLTFQGTGQTVTDPFRNPAEVSRVTLMHTGRSNFAVLAHGTNGAKELLVNEIGDYTGNVPLIGNQQWYLEIKADGPWTITVQPLNTDQSAAQGIEGKGDYVSGYFNPTRQGSVPYTFFHDGKSNFAVVLHCRGGNDLAQNEIGAVNNQAVVDFRSGPCYWEVNADGNWRARPK